MGGGVGGAGQVRATRLRGIDWQTLEQRDDERDAIEKRLPFHASPAKLVKR